MADAWARTMALLALAGLASCGGGGGGDAAPPPPPPPPAPPAPQAPASNFVDATATASIDYVVSITPRPLDARD